MSKDDAPGDWLSAQFGSGDRDDEASGTDAGYSAAARSARAPSAGEPARAVPTRPVPTRAVPTRAAATPGPMRGASVPVQAAGAQFTWGLRPGGGGAAAAGPRAPGAAAPLRDREPDPIVPAFLHAPKAARLGAPIAAGSAAPALVPAPAPAAPAPPIAAGPRRTGFTPTETDSAKSIAEVLEAPSPRRAAREAAAREAAAREEAAREAAARDGSIHVQAGADEPQDDGIDDLVDSHAPFAPKSSVAYPPAVSVLPAADAAADQPVRATGAAWFDVPVPTAKGPELVGRAESVAYREATMKASASRTQKTLLVIGIVLVVALALVLVLVLAQRADAAIITDAAAAGVVLAEGGWLRYPV